MKSAPQPVRRNLHAKPASPKPCRTVSVSQSEILRMSDPAVQNVTPVSPFRMNTCKSVSKQRTLTTFRMNTYEKTWGVGGSFVADVLGRKWLDFSRSLEKLRHRRRDEITPSATSADTASISIASGRSCVTIADLARTAS